MTDDGGTTGGGMAEVVGLAFQAWLVGLGTAGVLVLPAMTALDGIATDPFFATLAARLAAFVVMIPPSLLMTMTIGVLLSFPWFLLGLLVAIFGSRLILRHPVMMAALAPILTVVIVAAVSAATRDNEWAQMQDFPQRVLQLAFMRDSLLFAIPVAAGSFYYCLRFARLHDPRKQSV